MVTSFADGTKISFEQAIVANATGMRVAKRGMYGPTVPTGTSDAGGGGLVPRTTSCWTGRESSTTSSGAVPSPGVFVLATQDHPIQRHYLELYKLGPGPFYCFYTPYHLCHFEAPYSVARAVFFADAAIAPLGPPLVDVIATAKTDLSAGQAIDGLGGYMTYGQAENAETARAEGLLPIGLAEGATLRRAVPKDAVLTYEDVVVPAGRVCDRLRAEQDAFFASTSEDLREAASVHSKANG